MLQSSIEHGYRQFIARVAAARNLTPQRVDEIGQGRVWDGGTARQIGLVDRFGTLDDAVAEAAERARLDPENVARVYPKRSPAGSAQLDRGWNNDDDEHRLPPARATCSRVIAAERRTCSRARWATPSGSRRRGVGAGALPRMRRVRPDARRAATTCSLLQMLLQADLVVIALRPARPDDAAAIAAIYAPHVMTGTVSFEIEAPDARRDAARMAASDGLYPWLVATNGEADGEVSPMPMPPSSASGRRIATSSRPRSTSRVPRRARAWAAAVSRADRHAARAGLRSGG